VKAKDGRILAQFLDLKRKKNKELFQDDTLIEYEEEDVRSYWMTLRTGDDTLI
jgi:hypothetical protein